MESMVRAIDDFPSYVVPRHEAPRIIDCGANIGVSVLEWKSRWPMSQITCFEPDPDAFRLLSWNVEKNDIPGVTCIQAAVADFHGDTVLHGEFGYGADARGNSIEPAWGEREGSSTVTVPCHRLSGYLSEGGVDFLKLDIEGAEERVLREASAHLHRVDAIYVEVHETSELVDSNSAHRVDQLLRTAGFHLETSARYARHALPEHLRSWQRSTMARQTQVIGWRQ